MPHVSTVIAWALNDVPVIDERAEDQENLTALDVELIEARERKAQAEATAAAQCERNASKAEAEDKRAGNLGRENDTRESSGNVYAFHNVSDSLTETRGGNSLSDSGRYGARYFRHYTRAREIGYSLMADQIIDIADETTGDWTRTKWGAAIDHEAINRSRLKVDARKWLLSKALPKVYGDRLQTKSTDEEQPIIILNETDSAL